MLVGCYKDKSHLDWIMQNQMYNVRKGERGGVIGKSEKIDASILLLYNFSNPSEYQIFELDQTKQIVADYDIMVSKHYPGAKPNREYTLCPIVECINLYCCPIKNEMNMKMSLNRRFNAVEILFLRFTSPPNQKESIEAVDFRPKLSCFPNLYQGC